MWDLLASFCGFAAGAHAIASVAKESSDVEMNLGRSSVAYGQSRDARQREDRSDCPG
jgi:hypothetical protein